MQRKNIGKWVLTGFVAIASHLSAQENEKIVDLESYTVVASRFELPLGKVGASVTVFDAEEIEFHQAQLASETLRHVTGVYIRNTGGAGNSPGISMRGLPIAPLVLLDGIEINNPASGFVYNFGNMPASLLERVEVLHGAQSALYGANALTGVISLQSKRAVEGETTTQAGLSYGSHKTYSAYLGTSADLGQFDYQIQLSHYETDGYSSQPEEYGPEWADNDAYRNTVLHGRLGAEVTETIDLSLVLHYRDSESDYDPGTPSPWSTPIADNYTHDKQLLVKGEANAELNENWNASVAVTYTNLDSFRNDGWGASDSEAEMLKFELLNNIVIADNYALFVGAESEMAKDVMGDYEMETQSLFLENVYDVNDALTVTLGARIDDNDAFGSETTWRTSFSYQVADSGIRVRGTYGTGFDAPEISQLFGSFGNPDLVAETGASYDLGVEWTSESGALTAGVAYFNIDVSDKVEFLRSTFSFANVDWVSSGVEVFVHYDLGADTRIKVSQTFADTERQKTGDSLILQSPETSTSIIIDQEFLNDDLLVRLAANYMDDREDWSGPLDSFTTVDLAVTYRLSETTDLWVRVDNLLDEEYSEVFGYNGAPQAFSAGINLDF